MNKWCLFLVLAILSHEAFGYRNKRQVQGQAQDQLSRGVKGPPGQNPTPSPNRPTTQSSAVQECIRNCPVTSEYNPVCGSNGVTYDNPGRLGCAQACGVTVNRLRAERCPGTIQGN